MGGTIVTFYFFRFDWLLQMDVVEGWLLLLLLLLSLEKSIVRRRSWTCVEAKRVGKS